MKSKGKNLDAAFGQAMDYVRTMCLGDVSVGTAPRAVRGGRGATALPREGRAVSMKPPHSFDYIFGNPPFLGFTFMSAEQKADMLALFPDNKNLDFVCGWYKKSSDLIAGTTTRCAFVSTNSITQGETAVFFWPNLSVEIDFAYRTFKWHNEAKGNVAVHCVIIGFHAGETRFGASVFSHGATEPTERKLGVKPLRVSVSPCEKIIYDGETAIPAKHINCYLMDAPDIIIGSRNTSICDVPKMVKGSQPTDGGNLLLSRSGVMLSATVTAQSSVTATNAEPFVSYAAGGYGEANLPDIMIGNAATAREAVQILGEKIAEKGHSGLETYVVQEGKVPTARWSTSNFTCTCYWAVVTNGVIEVPAPGRQFFFHPSVEGTAFRQRYCAACAGRASRESSDGRQMSASRSVVVIQVNVHILEVES